MTTAKPSPLDVMDRLPDAKCCVQHIVSICAELAASDTNLDAVTAAADTLLDAILDALDDADAQAWPVTEDHHADAD